MTRMWGVDPELMCNDHLLGEHNEMHMLREAIRKHPHGEAIAEGHAEKQQVNTARIQSRHDALVAEMEARGFDHESPLEYEDKLDAGEVDEVRHLDMLADRCEDCRGRIV